MRVLLAEDDETKAVQTQSMLREAEDTDGVEIMSGAVDLVRTIPEGHWGVVTSGTRDLASARLRFGGLPVPKVLVTADDVVNGKPHPDLRFDAEDVGVHKLAAA